jgi:hypothetical protein
VCLNDQIDSSGEYLLTYLRENQGRMMSLANRTGPPFGKIRRDCRMEKIKPTPF